MTSWQVSRHFSTTAVAFGKRNFKHFNAYEFRGSKNFKAELKAGLWPQFEHRFSRGVREPYLPKGKQEYVPNVGDAKSNVLSRPHPGDQWEVPPNQSEKKSVLIDRPVWLTHDANKPYEKEFIPEMVPELIVPDLEGFQLKPYVSYRVQDIEHAEFTPQDLFHAVYTQKIVQDFREGKITEDGSSTEPSEEEKLTREEAKVKAQQIGSDYIW